MWVHNPGERMMLGISKVLMVGLGAAVLLSPTVASAQRGDPDDRDVSVFSRNRGWLGISFRGDQDDPARIIVTEVVPDTPAEEAGVRPGDEIVSWNGETDVLDEVSDASLRRGDRVEIVVRRDGERDREVTLVAERRPSSFTLRPSRGDREVTVRSRGAPQIRIDILRDSLLAQADSMRSRLRVLLRDSLGARLQELERNRAFVVDVDSVLDANRALLGTLTVGRSGVAGAELTDMGSGLAEYFDVDEGVLVLRVAPDTPASQAGLQEGDVIVRAGGESVSSVAELRRSFTDDGNVEMEVVRRGNRHIVVIDR
jgi:S1-C subfamily serine protease